MHTHSTHTVHTQYTHSTHTVHTQYTHSTHTVHTQYTHSTHTVHTQYTHSTHTERDTIYMCYKFLTTSLKCRSKIKIQFLENKIKQLTAKVS